MSIKVESLRTIQNAGNLKAFATISIADRIRVADVKVVQQPGQRPLVAMPSKSYEVDGQRKWSSTVEIIDGSLRNEITAAVLDEYEKVTGTTTGAAVNW